MRLMWTCSPERFVSELFQLFSKQLLGSEGEHMMEVAPGATSSMAQELILTHAAEPGETIFDSGERTGE